MKWIIGGIIILAVLAVLAVGIIWAISKIVCEMAGCND